MSDTDFFLMANLGPKITGLPMRVWISERGNTPDDVRVSVADRFNLAQIAVVRVQPSPRLIFGYLYPADQRVVFNWITLNEATIVDYWNGWIDTVELLDRLK